MSDQTNNDSDETKRAKGEGSHPSPGSAKKWRILEDDEIPTVGDEGWNEVAQKWEIVTIPSMWLAGGSRIEGTQFRRLEDLPNTVVSNPTKCSPHTPDGISSRVAL